MDDLAGCLSVPLFKIGGLIAKLLLSGVFSGISVSPMARTPTYATFLKHRETPPSARPLFCALQAIGIPSAICYFDLQYKALTETVNNALQMIFISSGLDIGCFFQTQDLRLI